MTKRERLAEIRRQADELEKEIMAEELITVTFEATQDTINRYVAFLSALKTDAWAYCGADPLYEALSEMRTENEYRARHNGETLFALSVTVE